MALSEENTIDLIVAIRHGIQASQNALLSSQQSDLERHTQRLAEMATQLTTAGLSRFPLPRCTQELLDLVRALQVYRSLLRRSSRYIQGLMNALDLCIQEVSYEVGPRQRSRQGNK